jgi:prefoldin alpha subunit
MNDENLQEKYLQLQLLDAQMKGFQQEMNLIEQKKLELSKMSEGLSGLKKLKKGTSVRAPMGAGVYVESVLDNISEVLLNVGADVIVRKPVNEAIKLIKDQLDQSDALLMNLAANVQTLGMKAEKIQDELQELMLKQK